MSIKFADSLGQRSRSRSCPWIKPALAASVGFTAELLHPAGISADGDIPDWLRSGTISAPFLCIPCSLVVPGEESWLLNRMHKNRDASEAASYLPYALDKDESCKVVPSAGWSSAGRGSAPHSVREKQPWAARAVSLKPHHNPHRSGSQHGSTWCDGGTEMLAHVSFMCCVFFFYCKQ